MQIIFLAEDNFCFISDCKNSQTQKAYKRVNNFFL